MDAGSGTVKVKARFANADARLWPGAFAKVTLTVGVLRDAVIVPQAAIIQTARGSIVYAIESGKAAQRTVQVRAVQGKRPRSAACVPVNASCSTGARTCSPVRPSSNVRRQASRLLRGATALLQRRP